MAFGERISGLPKVELDAAGFRSAEFVDAPVPRPLARIRGDLETLLTDPGLARHESAWIQATLTDDVRPLQAMEQLVSMGMEEGIVAAMGQIAGILAEDVRTT